MIVSVEPIILSLPLSAVPTPRSVGVHQSGIIRCIASETGILKYEGPIEDLSLMDENQQAWWDALDEHSKFRIAIGLAWEQWYISQLPEVVDHPGEMCVDGIYITPDGESLDYRLIETRLRLASIVHEVKATYKSMNTVGMVPETALRSQWMWVQQLKNGCRAANTRFAVLHALFLCGDYKWPIRPQGWRFPIEFTQQEIDLGWDLMTDYRDIKLGGDHG